MPELPISTIVIVVLCFIVLLAVAALLLGVWNPFKNSTSQEIAKNNACQMLVSMNCQQDASNILVRDFDANRDGNLVEGTASDFPNVCPGAGWASDNLAALCACYYNLNSNADCETKLCGCGTGGTGTGGGTNYPCNSWTDCCRHSIGSNLNAPCNSDQEPTCNSNICSCSGGTQYCVP